MKKYSLAAVPSTYNVIHRFCLKVQTLKHYRVILKIMYTCAYVCTCTHLEVNRETYSAD